MNVSQFVAEVKDLIDDRNGLNYPDALIVRNGDRVQRSLFRTLTQANKDWSKFEMCLQSEGAVQVLQTEWNYPLPRWVTHVVDVWTRGQSATSETTFSPYKWTPLGTITRAHKINRYAAEGHPHWEWNGNHTLRLSRYSTAQELVVECVAQPPRMFKGRIATVPVSTSTMYLPPVPTYGELELEEGAYINSDFQVTSTAATNATHYGEIRRCIYSTAAKIVTGTRFHELTFDVALSTILAVDDVVETVLALPEQHARYLVLKTAQACFERKNNKSGLGAIANELGEETTKFMMYATAPRDDQGPSLMRRSLRPRPPRFIDGRPLSDFY